MKLYLLDKYIIKKFLSTFFFSILLIVCIAVIFDFAEKVDDFIDKHAPFKAIIFDYYLNFVPYFAVLFMPLFTFISVIFFTSKMAYNTEIIAILSSGISYARMLRPYIISALIIAIFSFIMNNFIIPGSTKKMLDFEEKYYRNAPPSFNYINFHRQISPGIIIYMETYDNRSNYGRKFSIEKYQNGKLISKLFAEEIFWNQEKHKWQVRDYYIRNYISEDKQEIITGVSLDTTINMYPEDFKQRENIIQAMSWKELNRYIQILKMQGTSNIEYALIEKYRRLSVPFSTFILTIIGVCVSSRKVRGGIGLHIGLGLLLSFSYIFFMQFSTQFSLKGDLDPLIAMWIPNFIYIPIAYILYRTTPK